MSDLTFNLILLSLTVICSRHLGRKAGFESFLVSLLVLMGIGAGLVTGFSWGDLFGAMRLWGYVLFVHLPIFLLIGRRLLPDLSAGRPLAVGGSLGLLLVGGWAYHLEPLWLELETISLESSKVDRPIRIAVVADLQTDRIGSHERRALEMVASAAPDLVLLTGDYLQAHPRQFARLKRQLQALIRDVGLKAPLGMYAVRGDVDPGRWPAIFDDLSIEAWEQTTTLDLSARAEVEEGPASRRPLLLTGLSVTDSRGGHPFLPQTDGFHIVFGHAPDFALTDMPADLLVAGHTHGGQVRLPWLGPPVIFSEVPRAWSSGATDLGDGRTLVVSRGIGMERGSAPRLRFLCRPQVVLIDVLPKNDVLSKAPKKSVPPST